jgi:hypothetical protein
MSETRSSCERKHSFSVLASGFVAQFIDCLTIRLDCRYFAAKEGVEGVYGVIGHCASWVEGMKSSKIEANRGRRNEAGRARSRTLGVPWCGPTGVQREESVASRGSRRIMQGRASGLDVQATAPIAPDVAPMHRSTRRCFGRAFQVDVAVTFREVSSPAQSRNAEERPLKTIARRADPRGFGSVPRCRPFRFCRCSAAARSMACLRDVGPS